MLLAFFVPGDSILFAAGLVTASREDLNILIVVTAIFVGAVVGDQVGYHLGRKYGEAYLSSKRSPRMKKMVERVNRFYTKYGTSAVILARFYPWIRTIAPPLAGISKMSYRRFAIANVSGAFIWGVGITLLGYYALNNSLLENSSKHVAAFFVLLTIALSVRNFIVNRRKSAIQL